MNIKKIHFVGIKGVGMAPLAVIAKEAGIQVSGWDVAQHFITDEVLEKAHIPVTQDMQKKEIEDADLVITTGAHGGYSNQQVVYAKKVHTPVMTQGEAVGYFMSGEPFDRKDIEGISVAGCHGKTTTTAMIATMLASSQDPSYVIGTGNVPSLGSCGHYGKGKFFVAEADEYATEPEQDRTPKFLWQHPEVGVVTNIEYDHPDLYPTFASLIAVYKRFIEQVLQNNGIVVACGDDKEVENIVKNAKGSVETYGFNSSNNFTIGKVKETPKGIVFDVLHKEKELGVFAMSCMGRHNALNGLATIITGLEVGLSIKDIKEGLANFQGTKRRLEYLGTMKSGAIIFDDYAHHPTEIKSSLLALRERYKKSNIICVFQPHTYSRTKLLFDEFCDAFGSADEIIITDIFSSAREAFDGSISSKHLVEAIEKKQQALYSPTLSSVVQYFHKHVPDDNTIVVVMGAGDVYQVGYELIVK